MRLNTIYCMKNTIFDATVLTLVIKYEYILQGSGIIHFIKNNNM